ncbi:NfeD family protein [Alienimonas californiensis]|uniref:Uncharacterized protein n=1 Tax=Alienimonas californiensis TaxID=2527989 RepID=A0A517PA68_9PLAN|nr:NfeD family protein [Alienimonas californiensis]QDT16264.1 hypothetical protein CA12_23650 [Alienimonas californiensis]
MRSRLLAAALLLSGLGAGTAAARAQEAAPAADATKAPPAALVKVGSPVDEAVVGTVQNAALKLQRQSEDAGVRGVLVLELTPGSSRFGPVRDLAQFLTSAELSDVRTVAWVPESVDGNNAIVALACEEIVLHPDAELGDLGRGRALEPADEAFVLALAEKRHNRLVSPALVRGLADPGQAVLKVTLGEGANAETRLVTPAELKEIRESAPGDVQVDRIKEEGVPGRFSGERARALGILAAATAETKNDVARLYDLPTLRTAAAAGGVPDVAYIRIDEPIEPIIGEFVKRQIDRSVARGANLIVFELTSRSGSLVTAQDLATRIADLSERNVHTVAFVPQEAFGTAAMVALACDELYMETGARIGRVGRLTEADGEAAAEDVALARQELKFLAEQKGRPPAIAEALADPALEVFAVTNARTGREWYLTDAEIHAQGDEWRRGPLVPETRAGEAVVLTADRAEELGLARPPVADLDELKQRLGVPADVALNPVGKTWMDTLVFVLNTSAAVWFLLFAGAALLYLELHFFTGILGILSVTCFALFFWSQFLGGTAGWLEITLALLGLACLAIEAFVIPGFGVFGVTGGLLVLASLVMAMQTFGVGFSTDRMATSLATVVAALGGVIVFGIVSNRFLPRMPLFNQMILAPPGMEVAGPALRPDLLEEVERPVGPRVGDEGVTRTALRPSGKAEIGGDYLDVVSDGPFVDPDTPVRITKLEGPRVFVRAT